MKIAMMTNNYKPFVAGVPISVERLSDGLAALGHQVAVFAPAYPGAAESMTQANGVRVYRYRANQSATIKKGGEDVTVGDITDRRIEGWFRSFSPDILHTHHPFLIGSTALSLGKRYDVPVCFTYHTRYEQYVDYFKPYAQLRQLVGNDAPITRPLHQFVQEQAIPFYLRSFASRCDLLFAPTVSMAQYLAAQNVSTPVRILPTGLAAKDYTPDRQQAIGLRRRYVRDGQFLLCTVARLAEEKNLSFLLRGLACLKANIGSTFHCLLIGEGPQKAELIALAELLGLTEDITFVGFVPNEILPAYHAASDLFVFSSQTETQGIVLLEAMAAGTPAVAVNATGAKDVLVDEVNGLLTEPDEHAWANAIQRLLNDRAFLRVLGAGARKTAADFRAEAIAQKADIYYQSTVTRRRRSLSL